MSGENPDQVASDDVVAVSVLLWARPGRAADLATYEDDVLALLADHGATVVARLQGPRSPGGADEAQVIVFPTEGAFDAFMTDPARLAMADRRDEAIERTEVHTFVRALP